MSCIVKQNSSSLAHTSIPTNGISHQNPSTRRVVVTFKVNTKQSKISDI